MTGKIKSEEGPLNMDCSISIQPAFIMGKRGTGREDVLLDLVLLCATNGRTAAPALAPVNSLGAPGSSLQSGSRCQASGFGTSGCFSVEAIVWCESQSAL